MDMTTLTHEELCYLKYTPALDDKLEAIGCSEFKGDELKRFADEELKTRRYSRNLNNKNWLLQFRKKLTTQPHDASTNRAMRRARQ